MKRFAVAGVLLAFGLCGIVVADEKALKELAGKYKTVSAEKGGVPIPREAAEKIVITIQDDVLTVDVGEGREKKAKLKVDPSKKPAHIDITPDDGPEKGKTFPGLYKLDKDDLTIVFTEQSDRPKDFNSEGALLLKLKREKEEKKEEKKEKKDK
jgi:uncharacterized protein (TIGR03067 family)